MSTKITKKQLEKLIKEEVDKILSEVLNPADAVKYLKGLGAGASGLKGNVPEAFSAITTAIKAGGDDLAIFYKSLGDLKAAANKLDDVSPNKKTLEGLIKSVETAGRASTVASAKAKLLARVRDLKGLPAQADSALDDIAASADEVAATLDDVSSPVAASDLSKQIDNSSGSPQMKKTTKVAIAAALTSAGAVSLALLFSTNPVEPADAKPTVVSPPPNNSGTSRETRKQRRIRVAHSVIRASSPEESVRKFQQTLIDLGYSVGNLGADGDYGGGTVSGVKDFQRKNNLKPDGYVGTNTYKVLVSVAKTGGNKKATANAGNIGQDNIRSVRIYTEFWNKLSNQTNSTDLAKYLPRLISAQSEYNIGGKTVSAQNIGVVAMGMIDKFLQDDAAFEALKLDTDKVNLELERVKNIIKKSPPVKTSESYNLDFNKWSKLWK